MPQKWLSETLDTRLGGTSAADQAPEFIDELAWQSSPRDPHRVGRVNDLAPDPEFPVLWEGQGQGVLVDHDLDFVPRLFPTGLDVDGGAVWVVEDNKVGPASKCRGLPAQPEGVLTFDENGAAI